METTSTWVILTATQVTGVALIASKIDIPSAVFFLVFFSMIHSLTALYYSKKSVDIEDVWVLDFFILMTIAVGSGMVFTLLWIMSGRDELTIYMFGIFWSLLGIKWISSFLDFFQDKFGIKVSKK